MSLLDLSQGVGWGWRRRNDYWNNEFFGNNSVKALIVISFNEGHQRLLPLPLGWGGLGEMRGNKVSPKEGIFFETEAQNVWGGSPEPLEIFLSFEWGLKDCNEEKCHGNRKKRFCSMLYIASAKSWSARAASHQPAFMGSLRFVTCVCPAYL